MELQEFPKLEEYETPERKKEMDQKLPNALGWSLSLFLERQLFLLNALQPRASSRARIKQIKGLNRGRVYNGVLERVKAKHYLEALAILDISVRHLEIDIEALDYLPEAERDTEWKEERSRTIEEKDTLAYHRDRLIEEEPRLCQVYTKKDFENWAEETSSGLKISLKEETDEEDRHDLLESMSVLDKVLRAAPLAKEDTATLLFEINSEVALYREGMGEITVNYLLGEQIQAEQLLDYLGNIIKFRQFQVGVESGEWVKINRNT